ncbi:MAG TPA: anti-sigma factor antagonist [Planctomycetaceae bacterium]|nr:anti-sigma factor antagonist [Planctomycetaceae bacterium]HRF00332.1 STAS domain-containing protein [Pirellulaceae bacterium]
MANSDFQRIDVQYGDPVTRIRLKDNKILDQLLVKQIAEELRTLVQDEQRSRLLFDLSNVTFLSSAALNNLVILNRHVAKQSGRIVLAELQPPVREVFSYTGLNRLFTIVDSMDDGYAAFVEA